jgi:hypothetical protein
VVRFSSSKPGFIHLTRDITRLDSLVVNKDLFRVDITDVHLASSGHQGQAVHTCVPVGGAWGLWPGAWIGGLLGGGSRYGGEDGAGFGLLKCLEQDSERAALNFLWVDVRRLGVVATVACGRQPVEELEEAEERGHFGVKGAGLVGFEAGVLKTMVVENVVMFCQRL